MDERIEEYTIGELARASGVSIRALHHYDAIGLLVPARLAANGYRLYSRADALRLQEILFYRAAGMPLAEIAAVLDAGERLDRLRVHRDRLVREQAQRAAMLAALDRAISELKGDDRPMTFDDLYKPFLPEKQPEYEAWLVETYGADTAEAIAATRAQLDKAPDHMQGKMDELRSIEATLVAAYEQGLAPERADLSAHRDWVGKMWGAPCTQDAHARSAEIYLAHPDFIARYERLSPGFSQWLTQAMQASAASEPDS
jgi:DNA-binding transcriptional MerR regulator